MVFFCSFLPAHPSSADLILLQHRVLTAPKLYVFMAANVAFDNSCGTPTTPWNNVEKDVVNVFFGADSRWNWEHRKLVSYFEYYRAEIVGLSAKMGEYNRQSFGLPVKYHMDFLKVVK